MKIKKDGKTINLTELDLKKIVKKVLSESKYNEILTEQAYSEQTYNESSRPVSFTKDDRVMLERIFDVIVRGASHGGYGGVRRRSIPALGALTDYKNS